ncbi:hypothetical protein CsSME_00044843 [Camellia sinensis var. sinensis]
MTGRAALYKNSPVPRELVNHIKKDGSVLPRIGALRESSWSISSHYGVKYVCYAAALNFM